MSAAIIKKVSVQRDVNSAAIHSYQPRHKPSLASTRKTTFDYSASLEKGDAYSLASTINESSTLLPSNGKEAPSQTQTTNGSNSHTYESWIQRMKKTTPAMGRKQVIVEMDRQSFNSIATPPTKHYLYNPFFLQKTVLTSIMAAPPRRVIGIEKKNSERLLIYPMLKELSKFNLRTELRVARTIGVVVGCFTICWLPFSIIYILQVLKTEASINPYVIF
jgi:hypothetical protein